MSMSLKRLDKLTLWDRAYMELRRALLSGRFQPGQRILLREIAQELGISLTPVRDAVNHLIAERILNRGPGGQKGGATVPQLQAEEFQQLTAMRIDLESRLAQAAASRVTTANIDELEFLVDQMALTIDGANKDQYLDLHRRFHFSLYDAAQMPLIRDTTETLWLRCGPALNAVLSEYVPSLKRNDYHRGAVDALRAADQKKVVQCIRNDIREAGVYIHRQLLAQQRIRSVQVETALHRP
jgi:DNA-binding GntR family transcriptional regulator